MKNIIPYFLLFIALAPLHAQDANQGCYLSVEHVPQEEIDFYKDEDLNMIDRGHLKHRLYLNNFPKNSLVSLHVKRNTIGITEFQKMIKDRQLLTLEEIAAEYNKTIPFFTVSSRGFLPGEKITCKVTSKNEEAEYEFCPLPLVQKSKTDNATITAEIGPPILSCYKFLFEGFGKEEKLHFKSMSCNEVINKTLNLENLGMLNCMVGVLGKSGGEAQVVFTRENGERFEFKLPWGENLVSIRKGYILPYQ